MWTTLITSLLALAHFREMRQIQDAAATESRGQKVRVNRLVMIPRSGTRPKKHRYSVAVAATQQQRLLPSSAFCPTFF